MEFYQELKKSDCICSVAFGFNCDDKHINGIIKTLMDRDNKKLYIVDVNTRKLDSIKRKEYGFKLKVKNTNNIRFITVNRKSRKKKVICAPNFKINI